MRNKILVADDDAEICFTLQAALADTYDVTTARDGRVAAHLATSWGPDVIVADLRMPGLDGIALLAAVKERDPSLQVVIMTGRASMDSAVAAMRLGAADYLEKPLADLDLLRCSVARALRMRALQLENRELVEELRRANDFKSGLLKLVAHDLSNALCCVVGYQDLSLRVAPDGPHVFPIEEAKAAAEGMRSLLLDVATYGRMETEDFVLRLEPLRLASCVEEARHTVFAPTDAIRFQGSPDLPDVLADRMRTVQILSNLIGNAVKFSPKGAEVTIAARCVGADVEVAVSDSGMGIPPDAVEQVFLSFYRADGAQALPGSGLGLAIVKRLVELQGGIIGLESEVGRGTTVRFTVPCAPAAGDQPDLNAASARHAVPA